jgi:branched-chain amino acid transport system substrate-binding protein
MKRRDALTAIGGALAYAGGYQPAVAQAPPLKIGIVLSYSGGDNVALGKQFDAAVAVYMKQHGDTVAGRKVQLIKRDDGGIAPDTAARLMQELIVQDKVDVVLGSIYTPNTIAMARVSTQAKKPFFNVNAATSNIVKNAPYVTRYGFTTAAAVTPFARWAYFQGIKTCHVMYQDYGPGIDAGNAFVKSFEASGGKITDVSKIPVSNPDFSAYIQRVKDTQPQGVYIFLNATGGGIQLLKALKTAGIGSGANSKIKLLASGDIVDEPILQQEGDAALGVISNFNYSAAHPSKVNQEFVRLFHRQYGGNQDPDFIAVQGYDALHAIYESVRRNNGDTSNPDKILEVVKTLRWESPRGPVWMNPQTRILMQNIYIRRTERRNGKLENIEFAKIDFPRDPNEEPGATS